MTSNRPLKIRISITLDSDIAEKIRKLSKDSVRSFSQYINLVLKQHIQDIEKSEKETFQ